MKLNCACKPCRRRGVSRERHTRILAIGRRGVIIMWGVTAGKSSHNASNARRVTAGKMGRNSSIYNTDGPTCSFTGTKLFLKANILNASTMNL